MPPWKKSYIMMATSAGVGTSAVPLSFTSTCQRTISPSGKAIARIVDCPSQALRAPGLLGDPTLPARATLEPSLMDLRTELADELGIEELVIIRRQLADLLAIVHLEAVVASLGDEGLIHVPGELDVGRRLLDRVALLSELLQGHVDEGRPRRHGVFAGGAVD